MTASKSGFTITRKVASDALVKIAFSLLRGVRQNPLTRESLERQNRPPLRKTRATDLLTVSSKCATMKAHRKQLKGTIHLIVCRKHLS